MSDYELHRMMDSDKLSTPEFLRNIADRSKHEPGPEWMPDLRKVTLTWSEVDRIRDIALRIEGLEK